MLYYTCNLLFRHQPVHFLVYPYDWVPSKIILFYLSVQSISPTHPRPKDDRCAAVQLPVDTRNDGVLGLFCAHCLG